MNAAARRPSTLRRAVRALALLAVVVAGASAIWAWRELAAFGDAPFGSSDEKLVEIPAGAGGHQVVRLLARAGALSDERRAWWWLRLLRRERRPLRAGEYAF